MKQNVQMRPKAVVSHKVIVKILMKCEDFLAQAVVTYGKMKNSEAIRKIYRLKIKRGNFEIESSNATRSNSYLLRVGAVGHYSQNLPIKRPSCGKLR